MVGTTGGAGDERLDHSSTSTTVSAAEPPPQRIRVRASGDSARRGRGAFRDLAAIRIGYGRQAPGARARAARRRRSDDEQVGLVVRRRHDDLPLADDDVDLAPYAGLPGKVHARLD